MGETQSHLGVVKNRKIFVSAIFAVRSSGTHFSVTYGLIYPGPNSSNNNNNNNTTTKRQLKQYLLNYFMERSPS